MNILEKNRSNNKDLVACDYCKTLMMLIIVFFHALGYWGISDWYVTEPDAVFPISRFLCDWMSSFHVYTFVFVAGFVFYELRIKQGKYCEFTNFIRNKIKRLLAPYVLVSIVWCIPIGYIFFRYSLTEILRKFLLGFAPAQLWFLLMLFWVYFIAWIITKYLHIYKIHIATLIVALLFLVGEITKGLIPNVFMIHRALESLPVFWAGFCLRHFRDRISSVFLFFISTGIHLSIFVLTRVIYIENSFINSCCWLLIHIAGSSSVFLIVTYIICHSEDCLNKIVGPVKTYGMPIYLFHQQIIYVCLFFTRKLPLILAVVINIFLRFLFLL